jgi:hypothetical protein
MPINPNRPPQSDRVQAIQRNYFSDLPDANASTAFTLAWVEFDEPGYPRGLYVNRVTNPAGGHQWDYAGGGAVVAELPDMRFIVGKKPLNLQAPGSSTYETIADALTAVGAYQGANPGARAVILLHPDTYAESVTLPPNVSLSGMSAGPLNAEISGMVTINGSDGSYTAVSNLRCVSMQLNILGDKQRCDLSGVEISSGFAAYQSSAKGFGMLVMLNCNCANVLKGSFSNALVAAYGGFIGGYVADVTSGFAYSRMIGTQLSSSKPLSPINLSGGEGQFLDCIYDSVDGSSPIAILSNGARASMVGGTRISDSHPYVVTSPDGTGELYWSRVSGQSGKVTIDSHFDPNLSIKSPMVTCDGYAGLSVSLFINGVSPAFAVVPNACETFEVDVTYVIPPSDVLSNNAYALVQLPSSKGLLNRKRMKVINTKPLKNPGSGPIAILPAPGEMIGSLTGTSPNITSLDYLIIAGGDFVELSSTASGWNICG